MKKIIMTVATLFVAQSMFAQISIAPEAGLNLSNLSFKDDDGNSIDYKSKMGAKFGVYLNVPISKGFFFQPGILYIMKGAKASETQSLFGITAEMKQNLSLNYLEIPLNIGYEYDLGKAGGIFAVAGPYMGYGLSGKSKFTLKVNGVIDNDESYEDDVDFGSGDDEINALDFGLNFGAGYRTPFGVYARIQYGLGLANLSNRDDVTVKNKGMAFTVGYAFKIGNK